MMVDEPHEDRVATGVRQIRLRGPALQHRDVLERLRRHEFLDLGDAVGVDVGGVQAAG